MSDDEDFMTDRRGLKRAHESPQKINSLFEGQALDVGDECSVESDYPDWNEHFKNHPSQVESEDEATESDDNDKLESYGIETAIKNPDYWGMKDQDFKELAESFHAIYMDPDLRRELLQLEDGLDVEPDSAKDDESEMRSQIFDVFAQIQDLNKTRFPYYHIPELRPILLHYHFEYLISKSRIKKEELTLISQVFDDCLVAFKKTNRYVPHKDLQVLDFEGNAVQGLGDFRVGEACKERYWSRTLKQKIGFFQSISSQEECARLLHKFFYEQGSILATGGDKLPQVFSYNGTYWEECSEHMTNVKQGKMEILKKWLDYEYMILKATPLFDETIMLELGCNEKGARTFKKSIQTCIDNFGRWPFQICVFNFFKQHIYQDNVRFNEKHHLWAFEDAIYDLDKLQFVTPKMEDYISLTCGYKYNDSEISPAAISDAKGNIIKFLRSILANPDLEVPALLKIFSSCLVGGPLKMFEKVWFLLGPGRNGKGTTFSLVKDAMGWRECMSDDAKHNNTSYYGNLNLAYYTTKSQKEDSPNCNLHSCRYARIIHTSEVGKDVHTDQAERFHVDKFNSISGGDAITVRNLNQKGQVSFRPGGIFIELNHIQGAFPGIHDISQAALRERIELINFPYTFTADQELLKNDPEKYKKLDPGLKRLLSQPEYRRAFIELLFEHHAILVKEVADETYTLPASITQNKKDFFDQENYVLHWFNETFTEAHGYKCVSQNCRKQGDIFSSRADFDVHACGCQFEQVPNPTYRGTDDEFKLNKLWYTYGMTNPKMLLKTFTKEMLAIVGKRANRHSKGIFMDSGSNYLQGYEFKSKEPAQNHGPVMAQAVAF